MHKTYPLACDTEFMAKSGQEHACLVLTFGNYLNTWVNKAVHSWTTLVLIAVIVEVFQWLNEFFHLNLPS